MENSVNNNVNNSGTTNSSVNNVVTNPTVTNTTVTNPSVVNTANSSINASNVISKVVAPVNNVPVKKKTNIYVVASVIVGVVLLVAIVLLVFLLNGGIMNRNKMTCVKTSDETSEIGNYSLHHKKLYRFEKGYYIRVDETRTLTYNSEITNDVYNANYDQLINNPTGVSQYGFNTRISKEGNIITIKYYNPKIFQESYQQIKTKNEKDGFSCK